MADANQRFEIVCTSDGGNPNALYEKWPLFTYEKTAYYTVDCLLRKYPGSVWRVVPCLAVRSGMIQ
jgi:hypothetical protein